jgi:ABC-type nitrate/sulfonate/bicarbonate transport system substrate-binding protein
VIAAPATNSAGVAPAPQDQGAKRMRRWIVAGALALGLSLGLSPTGLLAPPAAVYAQDQLQASVGYYPGALISLPALVANDQKFFERNGLKVELVPVATGPAMTSAVASGSVTFVNNSWDNLIVAVDKGLPVRGVAGSTVKVPFALIARAGLSLPHAAEGYPAVVKDLVGKNWGVLALGVSVHFMSQTLLIDAGFNADDATFLAVGLPNTARPALQHGTVDVYLSVEPLPSIVAAKHEGAVVVDLAENQGPAVFRDLGYNGWWASTDTLKNKPDIVTRFARSLEDSYCWYRKPENLDQVVAIMQRYANVPDLSADEYKAMVKHLIPTFGPDITSRTIDTWSRMLIEHKQIASAKTRSDVIAPSGRENFACPD